MTQLDHLGRSYSALTEIVRFWEAFIFLPTCGCPDFDRIPLYRNRIKGDKILVPCMYENATIISVKENELKEEWRSKVHESITYGGCWLEDRKCFVTSSFYDKRLASWSY